MHVAVETQVPGEARLATRGEPWQARRRCWPTVAVRYAGVTGAGAAARSGVAASAGVQFSGSSSSRHGWSHVDRQGRATYHRRFAAVEPFYNGHARVERFDGGLEVIDETGERVMELRGCLATTQPG